MEFPIKKKLGERTRKEGDKKRGASTPDDVAEAQAALLMKSKSSVRKNTDSNQGNQANAWRWGGPRQYHNDKKEGKTPQKKGPIYGGVKNKNNKKRISKSRAGSPAKGKEGSPQKVSWEKKR